MDISQRLSRNKRHILKQTDFNFQFNYLQFKEVNKMKNKKKISLVLCIIMALTIAFPTSAFALSPSEVSSNQIRNIISNSWTYKQRGYYENNCLAWALGSSTGFVWPWGEKYPTLSQVNTFLSSQGYKNTGNQNMSQKIYAFGTTSKVTHFSKGLGLGPLATPMDAKWGHYEVFSHQSSNPYNSIASGSYGSRIASFTK